MELSLHPGEPEFGPWKVVGAPALAARLMRALDFPDSRPAIVAIDGRGGAGKSVLAERMSDLIPDAEVVATDDVAWNAPFFAWAEQMRRHVLEPLHRGEAVDYRPDAWESKGREGRIELRRGLRMVFIEGTGAHHSSYADLLDATMWVQSDRHLAEGRGLARDIESGANGDRDQSTAFWHEWQSHEIPFMAEQRAWESADLIVNGTPAEALEDDHFAVAKGHYCGKVTPKRG